MDTPELMLNYIDGEWRKSSAAEHLDVVNPASQETLAQVPLSPVEEVDQAARAAERAFPEWKKMPVTERVQYLFKMKNLLEEHFDELSRTITLECGKTLAEAKGEMRRSIENVEVAAGMPVMGQGLFSEDIARGIDEMMIRQPVGVCASISPFNFPGMIPFWYMPYAIAAGNTFIIKPSEKVPLTMQKVLRLVDQIGLPKGVLNIVNGASGVAEALLDHPAIRAISFVGSTKVARHVYARAAANGKRAQCQGGAKNPVVIMPDADMETTTTITADSAFGCAGQRCAAVSLAITIGEAQKTFTEAISQAARQRVTGYGLDDGVQMGPVITPQSLERIETAVRKSEQEGARVVVDGRDPMIQGYERGNFMRPTIIVDVPPASELAGAEIFGPVLGMLPADSLEEAIQMINRGKYGNMACIFTSSGAAARKFRNEVEVGDVGVNIGIAAPMAFFPFSGWKDSFFGDLHGQGWDAVEFFTQKKVVIERWPKEWSRKF